MKFYMPVRLFDEEECVKAHAKDIAAFGKKALIVTGKHSAFANGSLDDVTAVLKDAGIEYLVFSEVEENPSVETVFAAKDRFASEGIEFVIGIGGGSPMDAAKAIALVLKHPEADPAYLYDPAKDASSLPIVCVPTTCGTGSEVTGVSVLTVHDKQTKMSIPHRIYPEIALVDGKYLKGKVIKFKFKGKTYKVKTNSKGIAKLTIKRKVLRKLKIGKKITFNASYLKDTRKRTVKVKR